MSNSLVLVNIHCASRNCLFILASSKLLCSRFIYWLVHLPFLLGRKGQLFWGFFFFLLKTHTSDTFSTQGSLNSLRAWGLKGANLFAPWENFHIFRPFPFTMRTQKRALNELQFISQVNTKEIYVRLKKSRDSVSFCGSHTHTHRAATPIPNWNQWISWECNIM